MGPITKQPKSVTWKSPRVEEEYFYVYSYNLFLSECSYFNFRCENVHTVLMNCYKNKLKVKLSQYTPWTPLGWEDHSSYTSLTSALDGVSGQCHAPAALYHRGKDLLYLLDRRLGGPRSWYEHRRYRKNPLPLSAIEPRSPSP